MRTLEGPLRPEVAVLLALLAPRALLPRLGPFASGAAHEAALSRCRGAQRPHANYGHWRRA